jgi:hypothetical protein
VLQRVHRLEQQEHIGRAEATDMVKVRTSVSSHCCCGRSKPKQKCPSHQLVVTSCQELVPGVLVNLGLTRQALRADVEQGVQKLVRRAIPSMTDMHSW